MGVVVRPLLTRCSGVVIEVDVVAHPQNFLHGVGRIRTGIADVPHAMGSGFCSGGEQRYRRVVFDCGLRCFETDLFSSDSQTQRQQVLTVMTACPARANTPSRAVSVGLVALEKSGWLPWRFGVVAGQLLVFARSPDTGGNIPPVWARVTWSWRGRLHLLAVHYASPSGVGLAKFRRLSRNSTRRHAVRRLFGWR